MIQKGFLFMKGSIQGITSHHSYEMEKARSMRMLERIWYMMVIMWMDIVKGMVFHLRKAMLCTADNGKKDIHVEKDRFLI